MYQFWVRLGQIPTDYLDYFFAVPFLATQYFRMRSDTASRCAADIYRRRRERRVPSDRVGAETAGRPAVRLSSGNSA